MLHVDAGYGKAAGTLPFTGMRWLLLVIAIIVITACIISKMSTKYTTGNGKYSGTAIAHGDEVKSKN